MAKAFKGSLTGSTTNGGNITLDLTAINLVGGGTGAVAEGDLVFVFGAVPSAGGTPGWGGFGTVIENPLSPASGKLHASYKKQTATPDTSVTYTGDGQMTSSVGAMCYVFSDADYDTSVAHTTATGASTNPNPAAITPDENNTGVVIMGGSMVNDATITVPTNYVNMISINAGADTADCTISMAWRDGRSSGASEDPPTWTNWASGAWGCVTSCIKDAATDTTIGGYGSYYRLLQGMSTPNA